MSAENTSNKERKEQTTEQHECHIISENISGEITSNRKRKQETSEQCDCHLKEA